LPVLRLLRSYSRTFRVITVYSAKQNLLMKKVKVACVKNALIIFATSSSVQIVTVERKLFKKDAMLALKKSFCRRISSQNPLQKL
jgi:hypothetical protein